MRYCRYTEAIDSFSQVIQLSRDNDLLNPVLSIKAIDNLNDSMKLSTQNRGSDCSSSALFYDNFTNYHLAVDTLSKDLDHGSRQDYIDPYYTLALFNRALIYGDLEQHQKAIDDLGLSLIHI